MVLFLVKEKGQAHILTTSTVWVMFGENDSAGLENESIPYIHDLI